MSFLSDLWLSFCALPLWVRLWVILVLMPVTIAPLAFLGEPGSPIIASLAIAGLVFNVIPLWTERGFTTAMAIPHIFFWLPLMPVLLFYLFVDDAELSPGYRAFLLLLLVCHAISLAMDIPDAIRWFKRKV